MSTPEVTPRAGRRPFRELPEPVHRDDWVETVDVATQPGWTAQDERSRDLRLAGGGAP